MHNHPLHLSHLPGPRLPLQRLQSLQIPRLTQLLGSLDNHPTLDVHLRPLLRRQRRTLPHKNPRKLLISRAQNLIEERLPPDRALPLRRHAFQFPPVTLGHQSSQTKPPPRLLRYAEVRLKLCGTLSVAEGDEAEERRVEGKAAEFRDAAAFGVRGDVAVQSILRADQGLGFLACGFEDCGAGVFVIGQDLGREFQLVRFRLRGCLREGFREEEVCAVQGAVVLVVEGFEHVFVLGGGGSFDEGGGDGAVGEDAKEGCKGEFLSEVQEDEEYEVSIAALEGFVESDFVFFHGEEEGYLFSGTGFVVEELGGEVGSAFVVGGAGDGFEGDAALGGKFRDDGLEDCGFVGSGVADLLTGPMDVNFVGGDVEVFGEADGELVCMAVHEALDEFFGGQSLILLE